MRSDGIEDGRDRTAGAARRTGSPPPFSVDATAVRRRLAAAIGAARRALSRPTAGDAAVIVGTLAVGAVVGAAVLGPRLLVAALGGGLAAALATILLASDRPVVRALGGAVAVPVSLLVVAPALLAAELALGAPGYGAVAAAVVPTVVLLGFAAGVVPWERVGEGGVRRGATGLGLASAGVFAVVVGRAAPAAVRDRATSPAGGAVSELLIGGEGSWAVVTFALLWGLAAVAASQSASYLSLERFAPPDRRGELAAAITDFRLGCSYALSLAAAWVVAAFVAASISGRIEERPVTPAELEAALPDPIGPALAAAATAPATRLVLLGIVAVAVAAVLLEWTRRKYRRGLGAILVRSFAPVAGGAVAGLVLARAVADPTIEASAISAVGGESSTVGALIAALPTLAVAALLLAVAIGGLSALLWTLVLLRVVRILPGRAIGAAIAAGAVFVLAIVLATLGYVEGAIAVGTAAFVLWDVGEYADGVRTELGREATALRAELVHAGASLLTGLAVALATVVLYRTFVVSLALEPRLSAVVLGTGALATILVSWALRG